MHTRTVVGKFWKNRWMFTKCSCSNTLYFYFLWSRNMYNEDRHFVKNISTQEKAKVKREKKCCSTLWLRIEVKLQSLKYLFRNQFTKVFFLSSCHWTIKGTSSYFAKYTLLKVRTCIFLWVRASSSLLGLIHTLRCVSVRVQAKI